MRKEHDVGRKMSERTVVKFNLEINQYSLAREAFALAHTHTLSLLLTHTLFLSHETFRHSAWHLSYSLLTQASPALLAAPLSNQTLPPPPSLASH